MEMTDYPTDPIMLLSWANMKLRDFYPSLESMCEDLEIAKEDLIARLESAGYEYNRELNQFW